MLACLGAACKGMMLFDSAKQPLIILSLMIVPEFWAEARVQKRENNRQLTVRRYGWSDLSQDEAQTMAETRAQDALRRLWAGEHLEKREPRVPYNGAHGVPIREEILSRHGDAVITRNLYGAQCLNTPDVLFADVDLSSDTPATLTCSIYVVLLVVAVAFGVYQGAIGMAVLAMLVALVIGYAVATWLHQIRLKMGGGIRNIALKRIRAFAQVHPQWHLRIYETPAGFRVLVMHRTFDPASEEVAHFFDALGTDPVYVQMCRNQNCFRARLTPKPWRIGIQAHQPPRPGYWPVKPEHLPARRRWTALYEEKARGYAACRYLESLGSPGVHPQAESVCSLHDERCRSHSGMPLA
ncbi:hypothetical protein SAMN02745166_02492 [Prosthecobacter debontii]|uniref:Transmembrane protein n=2 Tax=Prosthecobacter debontii TaxID=48467 RepID=A0A1T4Y5X4_9BACT|nr:hypothetical protein SAMN02745166_02492 [Prosthecobacter debontii]